MKKKLLRIPSQVFLAISLLLCLVLFISIIINYNKSIDTYCNYNGYRRWNSYWSFNDCRHSFLWRLLR